LPMGIALFDGHAWPPDIDCSPVPGGYSSNGNRRKDGLGGRLPNGVE